MNTKTNWLHVAFLAAVLAAAGCGSGSYSPAPPPAPPSFALSNSSVDFGDVAVGATTMEEVTFSNTGTSSLTLQQNSVSGAGFATAGIGAGVTLAPGQSIPLGVSFNPSGSGKASGMATFTITPSSTLVNLPLSGNGVVTLHSADLTWVASTSPVVGYNIYRISGLGVSWQKLNSSPVTTSAYTDWDAQSGFGYLYAVTSVNSANVESVPSIPMSTTIPTP